MTTAISIPKPIFSAVTQAILASDAAPEAKELAAELVQAWIETHIDVDRQERSVAVEVCGAAKLDPDTWVVNVADWLSIDRDGVFNISEWKTVKGAEGPFWTENRWMEEITASIQLPTYPLIFRYGTFMLKESRRPFKIAGAMGKDVRVRVRACTKQRPPVFWPSKSSGLFEFEEEEIEATRQAYLNAAATIRALKGRAREFPKSVPWQATGRQCFKQFGRDCELLETCRSHDHLIDDFKIYDSHDPEMDWLKKFGVLGVKPDPRTVILSPTTYELWAVCREKLRVHKLIVGAMERETTMALQVGGCFHAAVAAYLNELARRRRV